MTLTEHLQILGAVVMIASFLLWFAWSIGYFQLPHLHEIPVDLPLLPAWTVVTAFGLFFILMSFVAPVAVFTVLAFFDPTLVISQPPYLTLETQGWINAISVVLSCMALYLFTFSLSQRSQLVIWGIHSWFTLRKNIRSLVIGALTWFICYPLVIVVGLLMNTIWKALNVLPPVQEQVAVNFLKTTLHYPFLFAATSIILIVVVPLTEEMLFRGYLQSWLRQHLGRGKAIIFASLLFSSFHFSMSQGWNNIELLTSLFVLSCFLGFVYERQQSLWASVGLHAAFNGISILGIRFIS